MDLSYILFKLISTKTTDAKELLPYLNKTTINRKNTGGYTPLISAIKHECSVDIINTIIHAGADINILNNNGSNALIMITNGLINQSKCEIIKLLIDSTSNINQQDTDGDTVLINLARETSVVAFDIITYLLKRKPDINLCNDMGRTALYYVVNNTSKSVELIQMLVNAGGDITICDHTNLLINRAFEKQNLDVIKMVVKLCANIHHHTKGNTLLHKAAKSPAEIMEYALTLGLDVNQKNWEQETPLMVAVDNDQYANIKLLLNAKADQNILDLCGNHVLFKAASLKQPNPKIIKLLIKHGAKIDYVRYTNTTAIFHAMESESQIATITLIKAGCNVNHKNNACNTPLLVATIHNRVNVIKQLLKKKININHVNWKKRSALIYASKKCKDNKITKMLIQKNAYLDLQDHKGMTALMHAAVCNHHSTLELLLVHGANPYLVSDEKKTALDYFMKNPFLEPLKIILSYGFFPMDKYYLENRKKIVLAHHEAYIIRCHTKKMIYMISLKNMMIHKHTLYLKPGNMGSNISYVVTQLRKHSPKHVYRNLVESKSPILDYLSIIDPDTLVRQVNEYIKYTYD